MHGGFFGVEVFFVISGFLITSLLIDERVATGGNDLGRFWMRRARRLLPALIVVLLAVSAWTLIAGTAEQSSQLRHDMPWAVFYAANWGQIAGRGAVLRPRRPAAPAAPLEPRRRGAVVPALAVRVRRAELARLAGAAHGVLCSPAMAVAIFTVVWFAADERRGPGQPAVPVDSDAIGRFAARRRRRLRLAPVAAPPRPTLAGDRSTSPPHRRWLSSVVCFVVGRVTATVTYPWTMALVSITSAIAVVLTVHPGAVRTRRLLGSDAMAAIGRRSYGIYLWHWPVFVVVGATAGSWPRFIVGLAIALLLSEACYRFVEMPIRQRRAGPALGAAAVRRGARWRAGDVDRRRAGHRLGAGRPVRRRRRGRGGAVRARGSRARRRIPTRNRNRHRHRHRDVVATSTTDGRRRVAQEPPVRVHDNRGPGLELNLARRRQRHRPRRRRCRCCRARSRSSATRRRTRCSSTCRGGSTTTSSSRTARSAAAACTSRARS